MRVAFLGTGSMGFPMARQLAAAGHELRVWNRTAASAEPLRELGAVVASSPGEACASTEVAITMVSDDAAVEAVMNDGLLNDLPAESIHLSMSTIGVASAQRFAQQHAEREQHFVAAPVFGRPAAAAAAKLWIVAGGDLTSIEKCRPLFDAMGQGTFVAGDDPGGSCAVKLAGNFLLASMIKSLGEAFALAEGVGVERAFVSQVVSTLFASPIYENYGQMIAERHYEPGFRLRLGLKDVRLAMEAAEANDVEMPIGEVLRRELEDAIHRGDGERDWAALAG